VPCASDVVAPVATYADGSTFSTIFAPSGSVGTRTV